GDGETSRDFCYIDNVVQMNILAAMADDNAKNQVYNVAVGDRTTLNELFNSIKSSLNKLEITATKRATYRDFRAGDVRHSQADISKAKNNLYYEPQYRISDGIDIAMSWYVDYIGRKC
ncbi:GDP-mannose 4,6-dehydratase, partial [Vibrio splendidus]